MTVNLGRICKDFARITSDSVDPGGSINSQLRKDLQRLQGLPLTVFIWGGGQLTVNLGRICKEFARITSDSVDPGGVNRQSTWEGSAKTLQGLPLTVFIWGGVD